VAGIPRVDHRVSKRAARGLAGYSGHVSEPVAGRRAEERDVDF